MEKKRTGLSVAAFVSGLLALACFPFGGAALGFGFFALRNIRKAPEIYGGRRWAESGIALGIGLGLLNLYIAIALPGNLADLSGAHRTRTMSDVRSIATAWESYEVDHSTYCPPDRPMVAGKWGNITASDLRAMLVPVYLHSLPEMDGWGRTFQFKVECPEGGKPRYWIRSAGKDGKWDGDDYAPGTRTAEPNADIVYSNGEFIQFLEREKP